MRAVDTNVLVRLITRDDLRQARDAEHFVTPAGAWVTHLVLAEMTWVLSTVYAHPPTDIIRALEILLNHAYVTIQDADVVVAALEQYRRHPRVDFFDYLVLEVARKVGYLPIGTFDRRVATLEGAIRI